MISYIEPTISDAHAQMMKHIIWNHADIITEDNEHTWEGEPVSVEIKHPLTNMIHPLSSFQQQRCDHYAEQLINGTPNDFEYTYHERLFEYRSNGVITNQIYKLVNRLKFGKNTRRAIAITWNPPTDSATNRAVPCLQFIQFLIRNDKLNMLVLFRSNDILSAFGPNAYALAKLQEQIADAVHVPVGTYTHIVTVPHLYNVRDASELKRWL